MKRLIFFLVMAILIFSLSSCNEGNNEIDLKEPSGILCLASKDSLIYIGSYQGLYLLNIRNKEIKRFSKLDSFGYKVNSIAIDLFNNIWLNLGDNGLHLIDDKLSIKKITGYDGDYARVIKIDLLNNIWFSSHKIGYNIVGRIDRGIGLVKFDGVNFTLYTPFNMPEISTFAFDKFNNLWIAASPFRYDFNFYLIKFDGNEWKLFDSTNSNAPPMRYIAKIVFDKSNNVWLGTKNGIILYNGQNFLVYDTKNSIIPFNCVKDIAIDINGNLWFALNDERDIESAIVQFDGNNFKVYTRQNSGLSISDIRAIIVDLYGNLWIGGREGLIKFDGNKWEIF